MKQLILLTFLFLLTPPLFAQDNSSDALNNPTSAAVDTVKAQQQGNTQAQQNNNANNAQNDHWWNDLRVLIFLLAVTVIVAEVYLIKVIQFNWSPYSVIRLLGLTLIIFATLLLSVDPTIQEKTLTHVIGLLGAIAGYLLGKDAKEQDVHVPPAPEHSAEQKPSAEQVPPAQADSAAEPKPESPG